MRSKHKRRSSQARRRASYKEDPLVPIEPFQQWLRHRVAENSITGVARNVGVTHHRIAILIQGWYSKKLKSGEMIQQPLKHVRLSTVDKYCTSFGVHIYNIYHPEMIEKYRAPPAGSDRGEQ